MYLPAMHPLQVFALRAANLPLGQFEQEEAPAMAVILPLEQ
jgi:hypothetical protein